MDFTNINDPAGVKALLDQLRASQAWQQTIGAQPPSIAATASAEPEPQPESCERPNPTGHTHDPTSNDHPSSFSPPATVASLLSQLTAAPAHALDDYLTENAPAAALIEDPASYSGHPSVDATEPVNTAFSTAAPVPSLARKVDLRSCTFQQALPHLARLAEDTTFVSVVTAMKNAQNDLEKRLFDERRAIQKDQQEKVKKALTRAQMIGAGLTQYEATTMTESFQRELHKFDLDRALPAWDGLISKQQTELESYGVPAMFLTSVTSDRQRQQRVAQVLTGMVSE